MRPGARASGFPFSLERYNLIYMSFFSAIVLFGTLYSLLHSTHLYNVMLSDPSHSYNSIGSSQEFTLASLVDDTSPSIPSAPSSVFGDRRNFLNRYFIKYAWFWTTIGFIAQAITLRNPSPADNTISSSSNKETERKRSSNEGQSLQATVMGSMSISLLRFGVATLLWLFFARWFVGPALMERVRYYSGAECMSVDSTPSGIGSLLNVDPRHCYTKQSLTPQTTPELFQGSLSGASQSLRARWKGGHDISGHTYILILSSLYLLEEITPFAVYLVPSILQRYLLAVFPRPLWAPQNPFVNSPQFSSQRARINIAVTLGILVLVTTWTASLLSTTVFFHTPQEKISGLLVSLGASLLIPKGG